MKRSTLPDHIFRSHYASHDGAELQKFSPRDFYVLQFIRIYAGAADKFGPIQDRDLVPLLGGQMSLRSFRDGRLALEESGKLSIRRSRNGLTYALLDRQMEDAYLTKVRMAEERLGLGAEDCIVNLAVAPVPMRLKRARQKLAQQRWQRTA